MQDGKCLKSSYIFEGRARVADAKWQLAIFRVTSCQLSPGPRPRVHAVEQSNTDELHLDGGKLGDRCHRHNEKAIIIVSTCNGTIKVTISECVTANVRAG